MVTKIKQLEVKTFNWRCPHCNRDTTISSTYESYQLMLQNSSVDGWLTLRIDFIVCPNDECKKYTLVTAVHLTKNAQSLNPSLGQQLRSWQLSPQSNAKSFPDYIPQIIREDYNEACAIVHLSPKASATLSRRCIQGMIRDFWKAKGKNLFQEIDNIKDKIDDDVWKALNGVRTIGNLGAHPEKDINTIIDVEPHEAEHLIGLIEMFLEIWYIAREKRDRLVQAVTETAASKTLAKTNNKTENNPD